MLITEKDIDNLCALLRGDGQLSAKSRCGIAVALEQLCNERKALLDSNTRKEKFAQEELANYLAVRDRDFDYQEFKFK
jgi:hypothetical protein